MSSMSTSKNKKTFPPLSHLVMSLLLKSSSSLGFTRQALVFIADRIFSPKACRKAFAGYHPTSNDLIAAIYARSGTNWVLQIAHQIAHLGEASFDHIHDVVPWPDMPHHSFIPLRDTKIQDTSPTGKRVIKTHLRSEFVPYNKDAAYVIVIRDPKDVIVSHYHFGTGPAKFSHKLPVADWLDMYLKPSFKGSFWAEHTAGFWKWRDRPNVLVLMFSEMKADLSSAIRRIADLMKVSLTDEQFNKVLERSSFKYMKAHESQFSTFVPVLMKKEDNAPMIRKGEVGGFGELLTQEQQARIDRFYQAELLRLGSDFPYAEHFEVVEETKK